MLTARGRRAALLAAACIALAGTAAAPARADSCTSPDLLETIPADGATGVPLDASLFAHYAPNAQWLNEPVVLDVATGDGGTSGDGGGGDDGGAGPSGGSVPVDVSFDAAEGLLQATPRSPLLAGTQYVVHWPALRGIDTATLGRSATAHFTTGSKTDTAFPTFAGLTSVSWDVSRESDSCTNQVAERYVFDFGLGAAADDGGRDALTLIVFEQSGPGVDGGPRPVLVQRIPPAGQGVSITSTDLVGHVCFSAIVTDLTGKPSSGGAPVCVDTVAPPFFYSCRVGAGRHPAGAGLVAAGALAAALAGRRRMARRMARRTARREERG